MVSFNREYEIAVNAAIQFFNEPFVDGREGLVAHRAVAKRKAEAEHEPRLRALDEFGEFAGRVPDVVGDGLHQSFFDAGSEFVVG